MKISWKTVTKINKANKQRRCYFIEKKNKYCFHISVRSNGYLSCSRSLLLIAPGYSMPPASITSWTVDINIPKQNKI